MTHPTFAPQPNWNAELEEPRMGIMLHYDASVSDASSVEWLFSTKIKVSYNYIVLDSGNIIPIAPETVRAWHAGACRSPDTRLKYHDANSAFWGISIAATNGDVATVDAKRSIVGLCRTYFQRSGWPLAETWRIVSHRKHAWPRGRKNDPEGEDLSRPVLNTNEIRGMVSST